MAGVQQTETAKWSKQKQVRSSPQYRPTVQIEKPEKKSTNKNLKQPAPFVNKYEQQAPKA